MALKLKGSTSGFVGLDAPAVAGNNTLILPENTGSAHQILANDITAGVTTFTQVTVSRNGDLTVPGTISIGGTLTYEDVTSVDSVGIVTARGLSIFGNTTGLNVASGISTFQGISLSGNTTGLQVASGISTFQAITATTGNFSSHVNISGSGSDLIMNSAGAIFTGNGGNASDPIVANVSDTNTGYFYPAADTIAVATGGAERVRIDSSGRVIITNDSVTNPTGTNTQYAPLVVRGNTSATSARAAFITFARSEASANIAADEGIGEIYFGDQQAGEYAAIRCHADAAAAVGDYPGRLTFHTTADGGTTMYERLRIDRNGKIGVGGAPSAWQAGTISNVLQLGTACIFNYNNDYFHVGQNFYYDGSNYKYVANDPATRLLQDNGKFTFYQAASGSADANITWTEALHIASDGNVHINTTDNGTANSKVNIEDSSSVGVNVLKLINKPSSSNGKARLELYAETSGGQGATAYIQSISGTDADGSNSANDAGLEFHTGYGGSGTDVTAVKIDNSGKTTISSHEGNNLLHLTPLAAASTSILINSWGDSGNSNNRNWAIRNRYNDHGRLEFMRGADITGCPLTPVFVLKRDSSCAFAGSLSKASGSFKIDHPLPSKTSTHHLVHSFIEGPQADLIYRGKVDLVGGTATVNIDTVAGMSDGTFVLLNREVQCFTSNETGWTAVKGSVSGNVLTITAQDNSCTDTISWMVGGERKDPHMYDTEWTDADGKVILEPLKETEGPV